jgi:sporulation protein YlmC with PRC-barrel domain
MNIDFRKVFRASVLTGMTVKNMAGQTLGRIEDVVIDVGHGRLEYAALSCGGFLGVGSKLFAIPWDAFALRYDEKATYFVLDLDAAKLQSAPGFDRAHWPDVGDPNWAAQIDAYYQRAKTNGRPGAPAAQTQRPEEPAGAPAISDGRGHTEDLGPRREEEEYFKQESERAASSSPPVGV